MLGALLLALLAAAPARAQRAADALTWGPGARAAGLGGAFVAVPDGSHAAAWNPANLSFSRRPEVSFSRHGATETDLEWAGFARPLGESGGLGGQLAWGHGPRSALRAGVAASGPVIPKVHAGAGLSLARVAQDGARSSAFLLDLGATGAAEVPGLLFSAAVLNLSPGRLLGKPPVLARAGASFRPGDAGLRDLAGLLGSIEADYAPEDKNGSVSLGAEYRLRPFSLRMGLAGGHRRRTEGRVYTLGLGYRRGRYAVDYAFAPSRGFADDHRLGVTVAFGAPEVRPAADYLLRLVEPDEPGELARVHRIEPRFESAQEHLRAGHPRLAMRELAAVDQLLPEGDPRSVRYHEAVGRAYEALGEWWLARQSFADCIRQARELKVRGPLLADCYAGVGRTLARDMRVPEALKFLEAALREGPAPERRRAVEELVLELKY